MVFKVEENDVIIVADIADLLGMEVSQRIRCESSITDSETSFKLKLSFSLSDELEPKNDMEIYSILIERLRCKLLVDNYVLDPSTMLKIEQVGINGEFFDGFIENTLK